MFTHSAGGEVGGELSRDRRDEDAKKGEDGVERLLHLDDAEILSTRVRSGLGRNMGLGERAERRAI